MRVTVDFSNRVVVRTFVVVLALLFLVTVFETAGKLITSLILSIFFAVALASLVDFFQHRLRLPRPLAILASYLSVFLVFIGIALITLPPLADEIVKFANEAPGYVDDLQNNESVKKLNENYGIVNELEKEANKLPAEAGTAAGILKNLILGAAEDAVFGIAILTMTFFLLMDGTRILEFIFRNLDPERERRARAVSTDIHKAVGGFVAGSAVVALVAGVFAFALLELLGVPFAVPLAVFFAFSTVVPLIGLTVGGTIVAIVVGFHDFPTALIVWGVFFLAYQELSDRVIQPLVFRRTVSLHPLLVIVAILLGGAQFGVLGALLAIPGAATVQIIIRDWWRYRSGEWRAEGARRGGPESGPKPEPA